MLPIALPSFTAASAAGTACPVDAEQMVGQGDGSGDAIRRS